MPGKRVDRVSSLVHQVLATLLTFEVKDPRLADATVTEVEISGDLREARIYLAAPDDPETREEIMRGLQRASGFIRRELGKRVRLRVTPNLQFRWDESIQYGARIEQQLRELGLGGADSDSDSGSDSGSDDDSDDDPSTD